MSSGSDGLYLSPLSDMSPATSDCLEPYFSGVFSFLFQLSRVCRLFWVLLFVFDFSQYVPFLGSLHVTTEGVRVSWISTDVREYWVATGTVFNVKTTTTINVILRGSRTAYTIFTYKENLYAGPRRSYLLSIKLIILNGMLTKII